MPKEKFTISIDSEIAKRLRILSFEKYGNSRSFSRLIEDLATGETIEKPPEACALGHRSDFSLKQEEQFNQKVKTIMDQIRKTDAFTKQYSEIPQLEGGPGGFFALKAACELLINREANLINRCTECNRLNGPVPTYPDAGKNFELYAMLDSDMR